MDMFQLLQRGSQLVVSYDMGGDGVHLSWLSLWLSFKVRCIAGCSSSQHDSAVANG